MGLSRYVLDKPVFSCFGQLFINFGHLTLVQEPCSSIAIIHAIYPLIEKEWRLVARHILYVLMFILSMVMADFMYSSPLREGSNLSPNACLDHDTLAVVLVTLWYLINHYSFYVFFMVISSAVLRMLKSALYSFLSIV